MIPTWVQQQNSPGGAASEASAFQFVVATTGADETFTIPCQDVGTFDAYIDWGDGSPESHVTAYNDANLAHEYATADDYTVSIRGSFPNIFFNNGGDKLKLKEVLNLGDVGWRAANSAFWGCTNLTSFTVGQSNFSSVTSMFNMLAVCTSLTTVDLSNLDTSNVSNMGGIFNGCSGLTTVDVGFVTSSVTNMGSMFNNCSSLTALDLSSFDTSQVTVMSALVNLCAALESIDLSSFDTSLVTTMSFMFNGCSSLVALDLSHFDTSLVTTMASMFSACSSLTSLDVSNFNTANVESMLSMFFTCSSLASFDLSSFDTSKVTTMGSMMRGLTALTSVLGLDGFNIEATTNLASFAFQTTLPTSAYDALLISWAGQDAVDSLSVHFGGSKYTSGGAAEAARTSLVNDDLWTITDGGAA